MEKKVDGKFYLIQSVSNPKAKNEKWNRGKCRIQSNKGNPPNVECVGTASDTHAPERQDLRMLFVFSFLFAFSYLRKRKLIFLYWNSSGSIDTHGFTQTKPWIMAKEKRKHTKLAFKGKECAKFKLTSFNSLLLKSSYRKRVINNHSNKSSLLVRVMHLYSLFSY